MDNKFKNLIVEGGAGTGKTVLAVFIFKMLNSDNEDFNFKEFGDEESEFINIVNQILNKNFQTRRWHLWSQCHLSEIRLKKSLKISMD